MKYQIDNRGVTRDRYGRAMQFDNRAADRRRKLYAKRDKGRTIGIPQTPFVKLG